jgi:integrase
MADKEKDFGANIIEDPRRPGALYVRVYHAGHFYKRRAASLSHARNLVHEIKAAIVKGEWPPKPKPRPSRFDDLLDDYRAAKDRDGKAIMRTNIGYQRLLERFGGRHPEDITPGEVEAWRADLATRLSVASVNHHLKLFRAILLRAVDNRRLSRDGLPKIRLLKEDNQRVRYLSEDEERRLKAVASKALWQVVVFEVNTGLRRGELLALQWSDIDFAAGVIWVRKSKSGEGRRVPMNSAVRALLLELREERKRRLKARVVHHSEGEGYVFAAPHGGPLSNLNREWYPTLRRAAIEDFHFHDLRHSFASRCAMGGVDLLSLSKLLGHKSIAMTMRYAHLSPAYLRAEVERLVAPGPKPWHASAMGEPSAT